jgi:hypothetical protein
MAALLVTFSAMGRLVRELIVLFKQPDARALLLWMVSLLLVGTIFYRNVESWSWLDSFYFCVITLSTVGFGDLSPTVPASKIFTIVYILLGLSIFVSLVNMLAKTRQELHSENTAKVQARLNSDDGTDAMLSRKPNSIEGQS